MLNAIFVCETRWRQIFNVQPDTELRFSKFLVFTCAPPPFPHFLIAPPTPPLHACKTAKDSVYPSTRPFRHLYARLSLPPAVPPSPSLSLRLRLQLWLRHLKGLDQLVCRMAMEMAVASGWQAGTRNVKSICTTLKWVKWLGGMMKCLATWAASSSFVLRPLPQSRPTLPLRPSKNKQFNVLNEQLNLIMLVYGCIDVSYSHHPSAHRLPSQIT